MNALLVKTINNPQTTPGSSGVHTVRLAIDENVSNWSTTPTVYVFTLWRSYRPPITCHMCIDKSV